MLSGLFKLFTAGIVTIFVVLAIIVVAFFALLTLIAALVKPIIIIGSIGAAVWLTIVLIRRRQQARLERVPAAE